LGDLRAFLKSKTSVVGVAILGAIALMVLIGPFFVGSNPNAVVGPADSPPSFAHPFGTDWLGKDILSQVVWGAYPSLTIAILVAAGSVGIGFIVGLLAGYFEKVDPFFSGLTDITLTFPVIPIVLLIAALYVATTVSVAVWVLSMFWAPVARAVRAQVLTLKKLPYVESSKTSGMGDFRIVFTIIVPAIVALGVAYFVLNIGAGLATVTALQFLGVGNPTQVSWGGILYFAQQYAFIAGAWWWFLAPGIMITLVALGSALIGFSVEEIMNPLLRSVE
jgi:peptide/nickel transport system permease protein